MSESKIEFLNVDLIITTKENLESFKKFVEPRLYVLSQLSNDSGGIDLFLECETDIDTPEQVIIDILDILDSCLGKIKETLAKSEKTIFSIGYGSGVTPRVLSNHISCSTLERIAGYKADIEIVIYQVFDE